MRKPCTKLSYEERRRIQAMAAIGMKVVDIAAEIGCHHTTIYKELKRGGTPYQADVAQKRL